MKKVLLLLLASVMVLFGCSSDTTSGDGTVEYTHELGTVMIPENPERIVTDWYVGELLALDVNLVGADLTYTSTAWAPLIEEKGVTDVGQSPEAVAELEPDLIITFNADLYDVYSDIAPTVYIPYGMYNPEELLLELGVITNTEEAAQTWIDEFNADIEELKSVANYDYTYTIMEFFGE